MPDRSPERQQFAWLRPLREGPALRVAAVVGTLINVYGQLLVPWLNGDRDVLASLHDRALLHPGTTALSVTVAYLFPLGVSVYSAAAARNSKR